MIASCEACSEDAELPFDYILDRLTGSDPTVTDYVLKVPARCLQCGAEIREKTLVGLEPRITPEQNDLPKIERTRAESQHIRGAAYFRLSVVRLLSPHRWLFCGFGNGRAFNRRALNCRSRGGATDGP